MSKHYSKFAVVSFGALALHSHFAVPSVSAVTVRLGLAVVFAVFFALAVKNAAQEYVEA